jgi:hypothetical protein
MPVAFHFIKRTKHAKNLPYAVGMFACIGSFAAAETL